MAALRNARGTFVFDNGRRLSFPAFDYYWAQYLWTDKPYEPDVEAIMLALIKIKPVMFVDGGANIGYWSIRLSSRKLGISTVVAIEANREVYEILEINFVKNDVTGSPLWAALSDKDGETVRIDASAGHAVGTVGTRGVEVETVTIASIIRDHYPPGESGAVLVKLDVEGCEIAAIQGAEGSGREIVFVFEDWPKSGMTVTQYLLENDYTIVGLDGGGRLRRISSVQAALDLNSDWSASYHPSNLIATRNPHYISQVL